MVQIIAHRGASFEEPENTLGSIKKAIQIGVDFIELDVHLSSDGIPVVIHDHTFCRTTNAEKGKFVRKTPSQEMKNFDAGSWFKGCDTEEKIPTLEEVLQLNFNGSGLMIEIKDDVQHDLSHKVMELLAKYKMQKCIVGSFSVETLKFLIETYPEQQVIGITDRMEGIEELKKLNISNLALNYQLFSNPNFKSNDLRSMHIWAWTVDDHQTALNLLEFGVKGLITNHPRSIKSILA